MFNAVCAVGWEQQITNGVKLHHATYYPLKADYPALVSDLLVQARVKATEAVKSAFALQRNARSKMPDFGCMPAALQRAYLQGGLGKPNRTHVPGRRAANNPVWRS